MDEELAFFFDVDATWNPFQNTPFISNGNGDLGPASIHSSQSSKQAKSNPAIGVVWITLIAAFHLNRQQAESAVVAARRICKPHLQPLLNGLGAKNMTLALRWTPEAHWQGFQCGTELFEHWGGGQTWSTFTTATCSRRQ